MRIKKLTIAAALFIAAAAGTPSPAQALPPPGDYLIVFAYYSDAEHNNVIGQTWSGCGQPAGRWGTTSGPYHELFFTPCS
ncbi:DUF6289 family protein [Nannocystaceae bacterium ST9]